MINNDAFPNSINLYNPDLMTGRGRGKYMYKTNVKEEGKEFFKNIMNKYFSGNEIIYMV